MTWYLSGPADEGGDDEDDDHDGEEEAGQTHQGKHPAHKSLPVLLHSRVSSTDSRDKVSHKIGHP